jgi:outer membrane biosynthesis protein TonB
MSAITIDTDPASVAPTAGQAPEIMPSGLALSAALHLTLIAVIALGLPSLFSPAPPQESSIAVELVTIAPETHATHPNPFRPQREAKPIPAIAPPAPQPKPELQPQPAAAAPPAAAPPPPPPPPKPKPIEAKAAPPPPAPKPKFAEPEERQISRPEIRKVDARAFDKLLDKLEDRPPDKPHPQVAQFDALLKNLTQQQTAAAADAPPSPHQVAAAAAEASAQPNAPLGSDLTASQKDLIIERIERCWDVPAGARDAKDLDIEIKAVVNPDGTVHDAAIVDTGRYAADPFFRAAADSAKRAVLNPQCSPLPVPPDKYEAWRNLDLFFNPKDLL